MNVKCICGSVELELTGQPILQYYCHCDDCQTVHGTRYALALYPAAAVTVRGETTAFVLRTAPRAKCKRCGTYLFAEVPGQPVRGVNGDLLPAGAYAPQFHMQCQFEAKPIEDALPHYRAFPPQFGGSGELMQW